MAREDNIRWQDRVEIKWVNRTDIVWYPQVGYDVFVDMFAYTSVQLGSVPTMIATVGNYPTVVVDRGNIPNVDVKV